MKRFAVAVVLVCAALVASAHYWKIRQIEDDADGWRRPIKARNLKPIITAVAPTTGCPGDGVTISGSNFIGATSVDLNGVAAVFTVQTTAQILTTVPSGTTTGPWHVVTPSGTATSSTFTVNACPFAFNMAAASPPTGITTTRTGSDTYAAASTSTVNKYTTAQGYVVEDYGDGGGPGLWAMEGYTNYAPSYVDFTNVGWTNSAITVTSNIITSPDGTVSGSKILTTTNSCGSLTSGPLGPLDQLQGIASVWFMNGSPIAAPNPGLVGFTTGGPTWQVFSPSVTWTRTFADFNKPAFGNRGNYIEVSPASWTQTNAAPGGAANATCDANASGSTYMWGAQTMSAAGYGLLPVTTGTSGAAIVQVAAGQLTNMLQLNGDWHMEVAAIADKFFTTFGTAAVEASAPYMWEFTTVDGVSHLWVGNSTVWSMTVNGAAFPAGGVNVGNLTYTQFQPTLITHEVWNINSLSQAGFQIWLNKFRSYSTTATATLTTMHAPSSFFLGSHGGTANFMDLRFTDLQRVSDDINQVEGVMLGDSLTSVFSQFTSVGPYIYNVAQARVRDGIIGYQTPGETIANQQARWDASPQKGKAYVKWVFNLIGTNDIGGGLTDVQTAAAMQGLINDIHTANPTAKIIVSANLPVNCAYAALQQGYFFNYNADILGFGPNPITDPGGGVLIRMPMWSALSSATTLTSSMTAGDTTANVVSTAGYPVSGTLQIDNEWMTYTNTTGTSFTGLTRGTQGSAAAHASGAMALTSGTYCYKPQYNSGDATHETDAGRQIVGNTIAATLTANGLL